MDISKLTMPQMLDSLKKTVKSDFEGKYTFNVTIFDEDGNEKDKYWVAAEPGKIVWGEGSSDDDDAVTMDVKRGGIETMKGLQVGGLSKAIEYMFDGSIYTTNIKGAEKWFELFELGEEALMKALGA
jgi:hypothetical protein